MTRRTSFLTRLIPSGLVAAALLLAAGGNLSHAGEYQDDLKARRVGAMASLDAGTVMVLWSAPAKLYGHR